MKRFFEVFFMVLGVIFFVIILAGTYFFITDPLNLKPLIFNQKEQQECDFIDDDCLPSDTPMMKDRDAKTSSTVTEDKNPNLSPTQEKALETIGVPPENIPSSFTPEQVTCFEKILGQERVVEIKAGDTPTATEFYKAKECI
jgi:hypothetical protein